MKTRRGFISNSSSSSFIVRAYSGPWACTDPKQLTLLLTPTQLRTLEEMGFKYTSVTDPVAFTSMISLTSDHGMAQAKRDGLISSRNFYTYKDSRGKRCKIYRHNLVFYVVCNQDEIIEYLVRESIPFMASTHYNSEIIILKDGVLHTYSNPCASLHFGGGNGLTSHTPSLRVSHQKISGYDWLEQRV